MFSKDSIEVWRKRQLASYNLLKAAYMAGIIDFTVDATVADTIELPCCKCGVRHDATIACCDRHNADHTVGFTPLPPVCKPITEWNMPRTHVAGVFPINAMR